MSDSRPFTSTPPYPRTHHSSLSLSEETLAIEVNNTNAGEGDAPTKRPRLLRDMQLDGPSGADSVPLVGSVVRGHPSPPHHSISSPPRVSATNTASVYSMSLEFGDGLGFNCSRIKINSIPHYIVTNQMMFGSHQRSLSCCCAALSECSLFSPSPKVMFPPSSDSQGLGLRAYLEDIDSDEEEDEDVLTVDEEEKPPQPPHPSYKPSSPPTSSGSLPLTKEQLLLRMEAVDREIAATEAQIAALQKRQAELEDTISSPPSPLHSSPLPSPAEREGPEEEGVSSPTATPAERWGTPKRSILESVYSENKVRRYFWQMGIWMPVSVGLSSSESHLQVKARTAHAVLYHISPSLPSSITNTASVSPPLPLSPSFHSLSSPLSPSFHSLSSPLSLSLQPLYAQPWEAPGYFNIVARYTKPLVWGFRK